MRRVLNVAVTEQSEISLSAARKIRLRVATVAAACGRAVEIGVERHRPLPFLLTNRVGRLAITSAIYRAARRPSRRWHPAIQMSRI
jgi:hypothetical protein